MKWNATELPIMSGLIADSHGERFGVTALLRTRASKHTDLISFRLFSGYTTDWISVGYLK